MRFLGSAACPISFGVSCMNLTTLLVLCVFPARIALTLSVEKIIGLFFIPPPPHLSPLLHPIAEPQTWQESPSPAPAPKPRPPSAHPAASNTRKTPPALR